MTPTTASKTEQPPAGWRSRLGLIILIIGFLSPLAIPLVNTTELSGRLTVLNHR